MLLARLENGLRFPVARNLRSPRKGKQSPSRSARQRWESERVDEIIVLQKEGPPRRRSWERPQSCPKAGSGSKVIWLPYPQHRQRSSGGPTRFRHNRQAIQRNLLRRSMFYLAGSRGDGGRRSVRHRQKTEDSGQSSFLITLQIPRAAPSSARHNYRVPQRDNDAARS